MSEASRASALQHAAAVHHGSGDPEATLATAEAFHSFIAGDPATQAPVSSRAGKPAATKPAATKPAAGKKAPPPPAEEDAPEEAAEGDVSKEEVAEAIEGMLNANLRPQALALFKKYGAKSLSGLKAEDYASVKQEAEDAVMNS